jgi:NADH-ubiquinone oxidoreductase chain 4L
MNLSIILFLIGILGFILNRKNIILLIISIDFMLLAVALVVLISSFGFDDNIGQTFGDFFTKLFNPQVHWGNLVQESVWQFPSSCMGLPNKPKRLTKEQKAKFKVNKEHEAIIVGGLLGDLQCSKDKRAINGNAFFKFEQGLIHEPYLIHLFKKFEQFASNIR